MDTLLNGLNQGIVWAVLALGVFISFRLLDFADLTCEGSFTLGAITSSVLLMDSQMNPILTCIIAFLVGALAGLVTGVLNTKLKIPAILSGILTLTALSSINLLVSGARSSIGLRGADRFYSWLNIGIKNATLVSGIIILIVIIGAMYWFFGTEAGSAIRATGDNEKMCRAQGINTDNTKIIGLMLSNALISLSGALVAQQQGTATLSMGTGAIVIGLASVIIGETLIPIKRNFALTLVSIIIGSIVYRIIFVYVLLVGLDIEYIKLITAIIVVIALCLPAIKTFFIKTAKKTDNYLIAKYPKYAEYAKKRDEKKAAKKEAERAALLATINSLTEQLKTCTDEKTVRRQHAKLVKAKEKFVEKYGSKELEEVEESQEAFSVVPAGGEDK